MKLRPAFEPGGVHRGHGFDLALIGALWIAIAALAMPVGDFPLNDDWVYALGVRSMLEKGYFEIPATTSANVGPQILWGALFCLPFGFSFTALRLSTLVLGLAGVWALYGVIRELTGDRRTALIGSLALAVNPLYFGLANSFMTDVPFISLEMIALYFFVRGLGRASSPALATGIAVSLLAILVRQFGLLLPVAFAVAYLIRRGWSLGHLFKAALMVAAGILVHVVYRDWLTTTGRTTPVVFHQATALLSHLAALPILRAAIVAFLYVGLFLLPFTAALLPAHWRAVGSGRGRGRRVVLALLVVVGMLLFGGLVRMGRTMPSTGNVLIESGLGPLTLRDTFILGINLPAIPPAVTVGWLLVTLVAVASGFAALGHAAVVIRGAVRRRGESDARSRLWPVGLAVSFLGLYLALLMGMSTEYQIFDRYLLLFVPFMMLLYSTLAPELRTIGPAGMRLSVAILVASGAYSVAATHDYMEWNRARWRATNDLMRDGTVGPDRIDGGYEFNGWYTFDAFYQVQDGKSWWWVDDDEYVIASGPIDGYAEVGRYAFRRWLAPSEASVVVLRRSPASAER